MKRRLDSAPQSDSEDENGGPALEQLEAEEAQPPVSLPVPGTSTSVIATGLARGVDPAVLEKLMTCSKCVRQGPVTHGVVLSVQKLLAVPNAGDIKPVEKVPSLLSPVPPRAGLSREEMTFMCPDCLRSEFVEKPVDFSTVENSTKLFAASSSVGLPLFQPFSCPAKKEEVFTTGSVFVQLKPDALLEQSFDLDHSLCSYSPNVVSPRIFGAFTGAGHWGVRAGAYVSYISPRFIYAPTFGRLIGIYRNDRSVLTSSLQGTQLDWPLAIVQPLTYHRVREDLYVHGFARSHGVEIVPLSSVGPASAPVRGVIPLFKITPGCPPMSAFQEEISDSTREKRFFTEPLRIVHGITTPEHYISGHVAKIGQIGVLPQALMYPQSLPSSANKEERDYESDFPEVLAAFKTTSRAILDVTHGERTGARRTEKSAPLSPMLTSAYTDIAHPFVEFIGPQTPDLKAMETFLRVIFAEIWSGTSDATVLSPYWLPLPQGTAVLPPSQRLAAFKSALWSQTAAYGASREPSAFVFPGVDKAAAKDHMQTYVDAVTRVIFAPEAASKQPPEVMGRILAEEASKRDKIIQDNYGAFIGVLPDGSIRCTTGRVIPSLVADAMVSLTLANQQIRTEGQLIYSKSFKPILLDFVNFSSESISLTTNFGGTLQAALLASSHIDALVKQNQPPVFIFRDGKQLLAIPPRQALFYLSDVHRLQVSLLFKSKNYNNYGGCDLSMLEKLDIETLRDMSFVVEPDALTPSQFKLLLDGYDPTTPFIAIKEPLIALSLVLSGARRAWHKALATNGSISDYVTNAVYELGTVQTLERVRLLGLVYIWDPSLLESLSNDLLFRRISAEGLAIRQASATVAAGLADKGGDTSLSRMQKKMSWWMDNTSGILRRSVTRTMPANQRKSYHFVVREPGAMVDDD